MNLFIFLFSGKKATADSFMFLINSRIVSSVTVEFPSLPTIDEERQIQKEILIENLIPVSECLNIIDNKTVNFWDKRVDQSDFLEVRIGFGNELIDYDELMNIAMKEKKIIISEQMAKRLLAESVILENEDILKSRELEKKIKDITKDTIKNDKQLDKDMEKKVRNIVAKTVNTLFRTLWQRRNFYEDSIKNDLY